MKITLTRALVELKTLDKRIEQALQTTNFCAVAKGKGDKRVPVGASMTIEALTTRITSEVQSLNDLINRRNLLKQRLVEANAATKVMIAGTEYTIAGAIEVKRNIDVKQRLLGAMHNQLVRAENAIQVGNTKLNEDIEKSVAEAYKGDKAKPSTEMYDAVANPRRNTQELSLLDPADVRAQVDKLNATITGFLAEVDIALSEINAKTEVEL